MSRFRPAMMHLVQSYDDRDNGTEGVYIYLYDLKVHNNLYSLLDLLYTTSI